MAAIPKTYFHFTGQEKSAKLAKKSEVLDINGAYLIVTTTKTDIVENTR